MNIPLFFQGLKNIYAPNLYKLKTFRVIYSYFFFFQWYIQSHRTCKHVVTQNYKLYDIYNLKMQNWGEILQKTSNVTNKQW